MNRPTADQHFCSQCDRPVDPEDTHDWWLEEWLCDDCTDSDPDTEDDDRMIGGCHHE